MDSLQGDVLFVCCPSGRKFSCFQSAVVEDYLLRTLKAISHTTALMGLRANQPIMVNVIALYAIQTLLPAAVSIFAFWWLMSHCLINAKFTCRII